MKKPKGYWIRIVIIIMVLTTVGFLSGYYLVKKEKNTKRIAVFLTSGQVYFGKIDHQSDQYVVLKGIYYLNEVKDLNNTDLKTISITKLGDELHGPEDIMYINRAHILYYEEMRPDSKINDAISRYLAKNTSQ